MSSTHSHKISFIKAVSWRTFATLTTMTISYFVTGKITYAITIGSLEVIIKIFLYYLHERAWLNIAKWLDTNNFLKKKFAKTQ